MALGFTVPRTGTDLQVLPDKGLTRQSIPRVLKVQFGDGYEQRVAEGLNLMQETYSISYANRPKDEIDDIAAFMDGKKGVTKFDYVIPDTNNSGETTIKVGCDQYNLTYVNDSSYTFTATFRRVYEA